MKTSAIVGSFLFGVTMPVTAIGSISYTDTTIKSQPYSSDTTLKQPNLIIILTDDQGYADVGFHGSSDIPTPNIDRIAENGVVFTDGYVSFPVCGPSRAGLLTGRYQDRFGFGDNPIVAPNDPSQGLPAEEETIASTLGRAGYTSTIIGKWHMGAHRAQWPLNRGFDEFFGFLAGGHQYFPELWDVTDLSELSGQWDGYRTRLMRNEGRINETEYLTDALTREGVDFIDRQSHGQPFFLYMSYNAPHTPLQATDEYLNRFSHIEDEKRRIYAAMVSSLDDGVGHILDKLEEKELLENTIVFFLSDNGGAIHDNASDNSPLRAAKSSLYEGGIRVPFAMQWPAVIPPGMQYHEPVTALDMMATIVAYSGTNPAAPLDGVNLVPYLTGEIEGPPHEYLFWRKSREDWYAVRSGKYKMLYRPGKEPEVYDLEEDIGESSPVDLDSDSHARHHTALMLDSLAGWESEMKDSAFLGLLRMQEYNRQNPDRFNIPSPFEPDPYDPVIPDRYKLVWAEEFRKPGKPDENIWTFEEGFVRNRELQFYQSDNTIIKDGRLVIEGRRELVANPSHDPHSDNWRENRQYAEYTSSSIRSDNGFTFQYGIMEVRARIDTSMGSWPAIWTLGQERRWPENGELDIMEFYRINGIPTILANAAWKGDGRQPIWDSEKIPLDHFLERDPEWPGKFHIWKMNWTEESIRIYLNEKLLNEINLDEATYPDGFNPFRQPHHILLNLALGSNGGDPSETDFPISYEVDYVRIYQPVD